ncbi:MAG TPA: hypothetical protein VE174_07535 [Actinomycetota bacterium]|nr:hypothetical protein [Actinomycetota bacterium]
MIYLIIMVLVAVIGISTLFIQQRNQRAHMDSVEGFRASLQKIAPQAAPAPRRRARTGARPQPARRRTSGRPVPLDARRRAEARRRVEARRRNHPSRVGTRNAS